MKNQANTYRLAAIEAATTLGLTPFEIENPADFTTMDSSALRMLNACDQSIKEARRILLEALDADPLSVIDMRYIIGLPPKEGGK